MNVVSNRAKCSVCGCTFKALWYLRLNVFVLCRYIIHSDDHNPYLDSMEEFAKKLEDFKPDLLVVGGLQMMDNFPFQSGRRKLVKTCLFVEHPAL